MSVCFRLVDPQVEAIIKAAIEGSKPFWVGILSRGQEVAHRRPVFLEPGDRPAIYFNSHDFGWGPVLAPCIVEELGLAKEKNGPWVLPLAYLTWDGNPRHPELDVGDSLKLLRGRLIVEGNLP